MRFAPVALSKSITLSHIRPDMAKDSIMNEIDLAEKHQTKTGKRKKKVSRLKCRHCDPLGATKGKVTWTPKMHAYWVDSCLELVRAQMRPTSFLSSQGYMCLVNKFNKKLNLNLTRKQMKNHWDSTKKDWASWNSLVSENNNELGWNSDLGMISAPDHWWDARLKVYSNWTKWRTSPLKHCFKLDEIYQDIRRSWAPSSEYLPTPIEDLADNPDNSGDDLDGGAFEHQMNSDHNENTNDHDDGDDNGDDNVIEEDTNDHDDSDDDGDDNVIEDINEVRQNLHKVRKLASTGRETKSSTLNGSEKILQNMDKMLSALENRSTATSERLDIGKMDCKRALDFMAAIPGMEVGSDLYMFGVDLFVRKDYRDMFLVLPTPEVQLAFLQRKYNMRNATNSFNSHISRQQPFIPGSL